MLDDLQNGRGAAILLPMSTGGKQFASNAGHVDPGQIHEIRPSNYGISGQRMIKQGHTIAVNYTGQASTAYVARTKRSGMTLGDAERLGRRLKPWYLPVWVWWGLWFRLCREVDACVRGGLANTVRAGDYS